MNGTEMRFLWRIENKTRLDRIKNEVYREELKVIPIEVTVQQGQLRWFGHVARMGEERLTRNVYEAKEMGRRKKGIPRKTWNEKVRKACEATGERWEEARRKLRTDESGNKYEGETDKTQQNPTLYGRINFGIKIS